VEREAAEVYAAVRPDGREPAWSANIPELRPTLRPYQNRALAWMVQRERAQVLRPLFLECIKLGAPQRGCTLRLFGVMLQVANSSDSRCALHCQILQVWLPTGLLLLWSGSCPSPF